MCLHQDQVLDGHALMNMTLTAMETSMPHGPALAADCMFVISQTLPEGGEQQVGKQCMLQSKRYNNHWKSGAVCAAITLIQCPPEKAVDMYDRQSSHDCSKTHPYLKCNISGNRYFLSECNFITRPGGSTTSHFHMNIE